MCRHVVGTAEIEFEKVPLDILRRAAEDVARKYNMKVKSVTSRRIVLETPHRTAVVITMDGSKVLIDDFAAYLTWSEAAELRDMFIHLVTVYTVQRALESLGYVLVDINVNESEKTTTMLYEQASATRMC